MIKDTPGNELTRYWNNFNGQNQHGDDVSIRSLIEYPKGKETPEQFLARGGKIQKIARGVSSLNPMVTYRTTKHLRPKK